MKKSMTLLALVAVIGLLPFFVNHGGEFSGSDGQAEEAIRQISPEYEPWFQPFFEPASSEIESLLFTLQGSIGAGVVCYILGYQRGRRKQREEDAGH